MKNRRYHCGDEEQRTAETNPTPGLVQFFPRASTTCTSVEESLEENTARTRTLIILTCKNTFNIFLKLRLTLRKCAVTRGDSELPGEHANL